MINAISFGTQTRRDFIQKTVLDTGALSLGIPDTSEGKTENNTLPIKTHQYTYPLWDGPERGTDSFMISGWGRFYSKRPGNRPHQGIDLYVKSKPEGKKPAYPVNVYAVTDGTVLESSSNTTGSGNYIKIKGNDGRTYRFSHLANPEDYPNSNFPKAPKQGTSVKAGEVIGWLGNSGTKPWHLHFEIANPQLIKKQKGDKSLKSLLNNKSTRFEGQIPPLVAFNLLNTYDQKSDQDDQKFPVNTRTYWVS